mgnify:CR=1 FL=1
MSEVATSVSERFIMAVHTVAATGEVKDLGYHSYHHVNPWEAVLLTHNNKEIDKGLRQYWTSSIYHRFVLLVRLIIGE